MAEIVEPLSEFIPDLPQLRGIVSRFNARLGEGGDDAWPHYLSYLGDIAVDSVKTAILESGINNRSGHLLDSVKFYMWNDWYGQVAVEAEYASALDKGLDMKQFIKGGTVVGMDKPAPEGTVFRTISDNPTVSGKNWEIKPHRFMELAKKLTADSVVQVVDEIQQLASPESAAEYQLPAEELPEVTNEDWYSITKLPEFREISRTDRAFFPDKEEVEKTPYKETRPIPILGSFTNKLEQALEDETAEYEDEIEFLDGYIKDITEGWVEQAL